MARTENADYLALVTSQYQLSTKFLQMLEGLIDLMDDATAVINSIDLAFHIDNAVGDQLDVLGVIIGLDRSIEIPISGLFFSWYDGSSPTAELGWGMGSWRDPSERSTEMTILPDDAYRQILKFKIIQNRWKGTVDELYETWDSIFAGDGLTLQVVDNQNMSMQLIVSGSLIPTTVQYVLLGNYLPLKPSGVSITYTFNEGSP